MQPLYRVYGSDTPLKDLLKEEIQKHNLTESGKMFQVEITEGTFQWNHAILSQN